MPKMNRTTRQTNAMTRGFFALSERLAKIDLFGSDGSPMPQGDALVQAVEQGAGRLPLPYASSYVAQLRTALSRLMQLAALHPVTAETLTGVVYQHAVDTPPPALNRFLAVVSDLYRSFLDRDKRAGAGIPLAETLPPLAMFQQSGAVGPYTLAVDVVRQLIGADVAVVSMPATYAEHPILWAALAHETGGHDITHADIGVLEELGAGIAAAFAGLPNDPSISREDLARLWRYWIDEAVADVYGLLNCGPAFVPNLMAYFGALHARATGGEPSWRVVSGFSGNDPRQLLDLHPADILRPYISIGALETLSALSVDTRTRYVTQIQALAAHLADATHIRLAGNIPRGGGTFQPLQARVPLAYMQQAARCVGGYIATARLQALNSHAIQDIETWDDADEANVQAVKAALQAGAGIAGLGDDAQLLAGATLSLLDRPTRYDSVTRALNDGLDESYRTDPIWGVPPLDAIYTRHARNLTLR